MDTGKNKSSILKPQKVRNPLSDLDLIEATEQTSPVVTGRPSIRRVSFASSNFIKEFATDPEKNTIWDTTYEEMINSDSTHSSENAHNTLSVQHSQNLLSLHIASESVVITSTTENVKSLVFNANTEKIVCTTEVTRNISTTEVDIMQQEDRKRASINFNDRGGEDILVDLTLSDVEHKENVQPLMQTKNSRSNNNPQLVQENFRGDLTKTINKVCVAPSIIKLTTNRRSTKCDDLQNQQNSTDGLIRQNEVKTKSDESMNVTIASDNMELTRALIPNQLSSENPTNITLTDDADMEFTDDMTKLINKLNSSSVKVGQDFQNLTLKDANMELTRVVIPQFNSKSPKNTTLTDDANMEFTQAIPVMKLNNKTTVVDDNMEFTEVINMELTHVVVNSNSPKNTTLTDDANMEFTQAIPVMKPSNKTMMADDNMEFTEVIKCVVNASDEVTSNMELTHVVVNSNSPKNTTLTDDANMEFTQALPLMYNNKTMVADDNMEFTEVIKCVAKASDEVTRDMKLTRDSESPKNTTVTEDVNMEFTQALPLMKLNNKTMEFTEGINCVVKTSDESMEFTQQVTGLNRKSHVHYNATVKGDDNMDFTKSAGACDGQLSESLDRMSKDFKELSNSSVNSALDTSNKTSTSSDKSQMSESLPKIKLHNDTLKINSKKGFCHVRTSNVETSLNNLSVTTPSTSFHTNFSTFSPCIDDTQHLINYRLSNKDSKSDFSKIIAGDLNPSFVNSKIMALSDFGSDAFPASPEISHNNLDCSETDDVRRNESKVDEVTYVVDVKTPSACIKLKRRSTENIETAVECKKIGLDSAEVELQRSKPCVIKTETFTMLDDTNHIQNISQENITLSDSILPEDGSYLNFSMVDDRCDQLWQAYKNRPPFDIKIHEAEFLAEQVKMQALCKKNVQRIKELEEEVRARLLQPIKVPVLEELKDSIDTYCSSDGSLDLQIDEQWSQVCGSTTNTEKVETLKEKIEKKCDSNGHCLSVSSAKDDTYEFHVLYKTILLKVQLNKEKIVNKINVYSRISDESEPTALFVHRILKQRLSQVQIQSAVGDKYDILTLLDYVNMNVQKMLEILSEFDAFGKRFALKMDRNFRVTFRVILITLRSTWSISVDMSDLDNITEDSVTTFAEVGSVNEVEVKGLVKNCPRGVSFLKSFISGLEGLLKRKTLKKVKAVDLS